MGVDLSVARHAESVTRVVRGLVEVVRSPGRDEKSVLLKEEKDAQ
jgi:hypothetical protein